MSIHRYSSRGRTRQPKNFKLNYHTGSNSEPITYRHFKASGSVTIIAAATTLDNDLDSTTDGANGYNTENQKFLHLALSQSNADSFTTATVTLYGYNRQFGVWGKMKHAINNATSSADATPSFMNQYVDMTLTSEAAATIYLTLPLNGTDRVAFVGNHNAGLSIFAAGSCD